MIRFSFSSFYMSMILANLLILFLYIAFHSQKLMIKLGIPILSGTVFVAILRMILPFEFLFLSHNIYLPKVFSKAISEFLYPRFTQHRFSIWTIVQIIWFIGVVILAIHYILTEYYCSKDINRYGKEISETSNINRVWKEIQKEVPKACNIKLRTLPYIQAPAIYGLRKQYILLPENLILSDKQVYYILHHEMAHYLHHDVLLKICVKFLCIFYWWNPFCKYLRKKLDEVLEMRVDQKIASDPDRKLDYLQCLVYVANHLTQPNRNLNKSSAISFYSIYSTELKQRFAMLIQNNKDSSYKIIKNSFFAIFTVLFVLSFIFIFEASYITPEDASGKVIPNQKNTYFVEREDGRFDIYINDKYVGIENSLEHYSDDMIIYKKEVKPNEKD